MKRLIFTALTFILLPLALQASGFKAVVIPVEFSDTPFKNKSVNVDAKVSRARTYFNDQYSGFRSFSFDVLPVVKLSREMSWYGANSTTRKDENIGQLVREACSLVKADLSVYDNDGDGVIDNICLVTAGGSEADGSGASGIWPQQGLMSERGGTFSVSGRTVNCFTVCAELSGLGTFCHEFAHSLGLPDFYDTDGAGSGGISKGLWGSLSLMDKGLENDGGNTPPNFCAPELEMLGIGHQVELRQGYRTLRPVSSSKDFLRIESDNDNEYFLLECRDNSGWDACIGGSGLLVYHIDKSTNDSWYSDYYNGSLSAFERWQFNQINCRPDYQCARILEAVPGSGSVSTVFYPQEGRNSIGSETDPALRFRSGNTSSLAIQDIKVQNDGSVSFNLITPVTVRMSHIFQDAALFFWTTDNSLQVESCDVIWYPEGKKTAENIKTARVLMHEDGNFNITVEKLQPATTYELIIKVKCTDGSLHSKTEQFTTKSFQKGVRPFIYLNSMKRGDDGSFTAGDRLPMRVYNATGVESVQWYFNDLRIIPDSDGFWHIKESGVLKAVVWYEDDSSDVIIKQMTVK